MTWTAVDGATGYEYARQLPDRDDSGQTDASTTSVTITGLDSGKRYGYNVRTIVNGQKSNGSNVAVQWTSPIAPRNLRAVCVAGTVVQLVWSDSPGAGSYEVKIGSGSWQSRSGSRSRIFSQLALNTAYTFYVRALISADPNFSLLEALSAESSVAVTTQAAHVDPPTNLQTSEITSSGIKLTWEASPTSGVTSYEVSANGGAWVDSGSDLEHSFTGLDPDTNYRLRARAKTSAANSCSARATAVSTLPDPPAAPTSASIDYLDSAQTAIILTWTKAEGATDYQVNGGALTEWTSVGDVATYTFAGLTADTEYTVQLRASNTGGTSAAVQATGRTLPNAPATPADLTVSARTQTTITVTWTKSAGADSYEAYGGTKKLPTVNDIGDVATYTFSGLTADTQYTLQVRALNDGGYSSNAQVVTRTLPNPPAAPTALKTSGITQTGVTLTWTKSTGATGYKARKDSGDSWTELGDVATYSFTGLSGGTSYDLELRASNAGGDSAVEDITVLTLPAPPTSLATSGITESGITLGWTKSTGATGYKVQADAGTVTSLGDVATHSFASLSAGTSYTLKVIATNASGDSTAATITAVTLPAAPTALKTSGITHNSVTLTWSKSTGATGYKVQANAGAVTTLGDVATYSFSSLASGTSHTLKVSATNASGDSAAATIAALTLPAAPTGLTTSGITKTGITLTWTKSAGATAYKVRKDSGDSWTVLGDVATYGFTGLTADTEYDLEVLASNAGGDSAAASVSATTLPNAPAAPTSLATSGITQTSVTLTWAKSAGATAYKVRAGTTGDFTALGNVATYTFTGLTANTAYTLQVVASNAGGDSSIAQTTATTNNVPPPPAPAAPTSLSTSGITQSGITLGWTKSTGATAYKVRKDSGDSWTVLGDVATYAFTGLTADTEYDLEVLASNAGGDSAAASVTVSTLPNAPAAPTQLATSGITQTGITLTWSKSTGATAYKVRAGTTGDFTALGNVATYTFTGLTANTAYTLQVRASNAGGDSSIAQTTATTNNVPPPPAPAAPTDLATSGITQTGVTLTWTKSTGATGYKVRKDSGDSWTVLGDVATYAFTGLTADTEYDLEVLASNAGGDSAAASVSATTLPDVPAAPTGLKTSGITKSGITLTWTKSAGATAYKARKDSGDSWTVLGDVATYAFTGLTVDTEYDLEVLASNAGGDSAAASVTVSTLPNAPAAPTNLATSGITQTGITLTWSKSAGAASYEVDGGALSDWTDVGDVATYTFASLTAGTSYDLELRAKNRGGDSSTVSVSASTLPVVPIGLTTSGITQTGITLTWTKSAGATGYDVKLSTANSWTALGDVATYNFTGLTANTQYTLQVRAKNSSGATAAASSTARTLAQQPALASPGSVATSGITQNSITLTWTKSADASSYEVQGGALTSWTDVGDVATYSFTGLTADTQYTLQARAKDSQRTSAAVSVNARTLPNPPGQPSGLQASLTEPDSVEVEWSPSAGAQSYEILGTANSDDPVGQAVAIGALGNWMNVGNVNSYVISRLSPDTEYTVEVRAVNLGGASTPSAVDFRTQADRQPLVVVGRGGLSQDNSDAREASGARTGGALNAPATLSLPAFNCTDAEKAIVSISPQPNGLNVQCVGPVGVGSPSLTQRGIILGVDVWGWVRGFFEVCFKQAGDLVFLDAAYAPRLQSNVDPYSRAGMICSQVDRAGTLVLLRPSSTSPTAAPTLAATAIPTAIPTATPRPVPAQPSDCKATTTDPLNFRASPGGRILLTLPALTTVNVYDRQSGWLQVEYNGRRGWISSVYTVQTGVCG